MNLSRLIEQKRKEKARQANIKKAKTFAFGIAAGACAGALSGILLAPKSGKETRDDIKKNAADLNEKVKAKTIEARDNAKSNLADAKSKIKDYLDSKKSCENKDETTLEDNTEEMKVEEN